MSTSRTRTATVTLLRIVTVLAALAAGIGLVLIGVGAVTADQSGQRREDAAPRAIVDTVQRAQVVESVAADAKTIDTGAEPVPSPVEGNAVFTATGAAAGSEASLGAVVAEVNGRPVVVLTGEAPLYRTLKQGDRGQDVARVQDSLALLGRAWGVERGVFGPETARSLGRLWRDIGYLPVRADGSVIPAAEGDDDAALVRGEAFMAASLPMRVLTQCGVTRQAVQGALCTVASGGRELVVNVQASEAARVKGTEKVVITSGSKRWEGRLNGRAGTVPDAPGGGAPSQSGPASQNGTGPQAGPQSRGGGPGGSGGSGQPSTPPESGQQNGGGALPQAPSSAGSSGPAGPATFRVTLKGTDAPPPAGGTLTATITIAESPADSLVVPSTAVRREGERAWVRTEAGQDEEVRVGLCTAGRCAVEPRRTGGLKAGTRIVVGETLPPATEPKSER
ncbi:hypothetical protein [Falsarthrobacter nasiphocae]|uniref:Peptidoglycan binding domain-containing protein n=1 Tax=Falsarthrobacter nasiphocae TaxID=189863 RepID=A0AAE3YGX6_9MICC|nr:hypothetical protein [Falsarthrobacter nasiphocae]MDR6891965.1 hypothetical protein [Falsarthrobacter nasiphocae]